MAFDSNFKPVLRFMVTSDVHIKDDPGIEEERLEKEVKQRDSQIAMENNVKKGQDDAEKRAEGKIQTILLFAYRCRARKNV